MGKARVLGNNAVLKVKSGSTEVTVGEIDKFSAKNLNELKKFQPLGEKVPSSQVVHTGWDLSFEGGKVDWALSSALHVQDVTISNGGRSPYFTVEQTISYYDGKSETFTYNDVSLHGYEIDAPSAMEAMTEKVQGFAADRTMLATSGNKSDVDSLTTTITATLKAMTGAPVYDTTR